MVEMHVREEDNNKLEKLVENSKLTRDREIKANEKRRIKLEKLEEAQQQKILLQKS